MGNDVVKWEEELAKHAKAAAAVERPAVSRIGLRGGVMTLLEQRIPGNRLPAIILASIVEQAYYSKPYDPQKPEAPDCFAFSETGEDMAPHEKAYDPQSSSCAGCPQNQWGTAGNGRKGKACKQKRKLLLMPASAIKDGNITKAELALLDVPVTSVKNWSNYVNRLAATSARPPWAVVTIITVEPDPKNQFVINFDSELEIPTQHLGDLHARLQGAKDILLTPYEKTEQGLSQQTQAMQTGKKY